MSKTLNSIFFKLRKIEFDNISKIGVVIPMVKEGLIMESKIKLLELNGNVEIYNTDGIDIKAPRVVLHRLLKDAIYDVIINLKEINKCKIGMFKGKSGYTQDYLFYNKLLLEKSISHMVLEYNKRSKKDKNDNSKRVILKSKKIKNNDIKVEENPVVIKKCDLLEHKYQCSSSKYIHKIDYSFLDNQENAIEYPKDNSIEILENKLNISNENNHPINKITKPKFKLGAIIILNSIVEIIDDYDTNISIRIYLKSKNSLNRLLRLYRYIKIEETCEYNAIYKVDMNVRYDLYLKIVDVFGNPYLKDFLYIRYEDNLNSTILSQNINLSKPYINSINNYEKQITLSKYKGKLSELFSTAILDNLNELNILE